MRGTLDKLLTLRELKSKLEQHGQFPRVAEKKYTRNTGEESGPEEKA